MGMKNNDINGFELIEGLSGKSDFWVCGKRNGGVFSAVRVYMRKRPPLLAPARSVAAEGENDRGSTFPCNAVGSPFYKDNSSLIMGIVLLLFFITALFLELKMPISGTRWSSIMVVLSFFAAWFLDSFFSNMPQMMEFSWEGVSFFVNGRLSRKISAAALRQIYFVKSAFMIGRKTFAAFNLIAVVEEPGELGAGRLSSLTLLKNVPFYESALFLVKESERMMGLQDVPMPGEAKQRDPGSAYEAALFLDKESGRMMGLQDVPMTGEASQGGDSCARWSLDSASVGLSSLPLSLGSLEKDCVAASISGSGDKERLEVRVRTRPFGPWSDFVGWNRWKFFKSVLIFPPVFLAVVFALFSFLMFSDGLGSYRGILIIAMPVSIGLLLFVVFPAVIILNRTDFSILFSKDFVVVSCTRPYFEKVIRRSEISRIYCEECPTKSTPVYDVRLLDSEAKTRSLVSGVRSFETANFIESNANRIMGIAVGRAGGDD